MAILDWPQCDAVESVPGTAGGAVAWQSITPSPVARFASTSVRTVLYSWQCATYLAEKNRRTTNKEDSLSKAKEFAEDWYLQLRGKLRDGELKSGKLFREGAKLYLREFDIMTQGQHSPTYARGQHAGTNGHLVDVQM